MELKDYIAETACSVMAGIELANQKLKDQKLGSVWKQNIVTKGADLVLLGFAKRQDPNDTDKSFPVLVLQFDANVTLEDKKKSSNEVSAEAGGKALTIFSFKGKVKAGSEASLLEKSVQNVKFSVPIDFAEH